MKKVLLLNPPGDKKYFRDYYCSLVSKAKYYYHPLDLVYLSGRLSKNFGVSVIDAIVEGMSEAACLEKIKQIDPDVIVFLISSPSYFNDVKFLTKTKKMLPHVIFIGSGDVYRDFREKAFSQHKFLDAILLDFSTDDILKYLNNSSGQVIKNIIYKTKGRIVVGEEKHDHGLFDMPIPRWDLFNLKKYSFPFSKKRYYATILTDFGCAYKCSFCPMSTLGFKLRKIDTVIDEIKLLKSLGISELFIRDQTFGVNKKRTFELCDEFLNNNLNVSWTCFSRVDVITEELLKKIKEAGCHTVMFGIESANEEILKEYNKNTSMKQILEAIDICKKQGLNVVGTFMIGFPGETRESILSTIEFAKKLKLDYASFNIATPRFGTSFRKMAIQKGWVDEKTVKMDAGRSKPVWKKNELSNEEIFELQRLAIKSFYLRSEYIIQKLISIRSLYQFYNSFSEAMSLLF